MTLRDLIADEPVGCDEDGCLEPHKALGKCNRHYRAVQRNRTVTKCSHCGTRLQAPTELCGFCEIETDPARLAAWEHAMAEGMTA